MLNLGISVFKKIKSRSKKVKISRNLGKKIKKSWNLGKKRADLGISETYVPPSKVVDNKHTLYMFVQVDPPISKMSKLLKFRYISISQQQDLQEHLKTTKTNVKSLTV